MRKKYEAIKDLYQSRSSHNVEKLISELYGEQPLPILIGTSSAEVYFDRESISKLIKNDLTDWGDVDFDLSSLTTNRYGPYQVSHCKGTVKFTFTYDDATYDRFSSIITDIKNDPFGSSYQKAVLIQQLLAHFLHDRQSSKRDYLWPLSLDMISKDDQVTTLQFSMPVNDDLPDARLDDFDPYSKSAFDKEVSIIAKHASINQDTKVIDFIKQHVKTTKHADQVSIETPHTVVDERDGYLSFFCVGTYTLTKTLEERLQSLFANFHENHHPKKKLFNIQRDIAQHLLHDAIGTSMIVHFRALGIIKKNGNDYSMEFMKVTLPFNLILEEKVDEDIVL